MDVDVETDVDVEDVDVEDVEVKVDACVGVEVGTVADKEMDINMNSRKRLTSCNASLTGE